MRSLFDNGWLESIVGSLIATLLVVIGRKIWTKLQQRRLSRDSSTARRQEPAVALSSIPFHWVWQPVEQVKPLFAWVWNAIQRLKGVADRIKHPVKFGFLVSVLFVVLVSLTVAMSHHTVPQPSPTSPIPVQSPAHGGADNIVAPEADETSSHFAIPTPAVSPSPIALATPRTWFPPEARSDHSATEAARSSHGSPNRKLAVPATQSYQVVSVQPPGGRIIECQVIMSALDPRSWDEVWLSLRDVIRQDSNSAPPICTLELLSLTISAESSGPEQCQASVATLAYELTTRTKGVIMQDSVPGNGGCYEADEAQADMAAAQDAVGHLRRSLGIL